MDSNQNISVPIERIAKLAGMVDAHAFHLATVAGQPCHPIIFDVWDSAKEMSEWLHEQWNEYDRVNKGTEESSQTD